MITHVNRYTTILSGISILTIFEIDKLNSILNDITFISTVLHILAQLYQNGEHLTIR